MSMDSNSAPGVVIVGAGQAGCEAAFALRTAGYLGSIDLVGDEAFPPYRRPPLSKQFIANDAAIETLLIKPLAAYEKAGIRLHLDAPVARVDRKLQRVFLQNGQALAYGHLILATGGHARGLSLPGSNARGVHVLRGIHDALALRAKFHPGQKLVVIGGGFVGLEVAALAIQHGLQVTVLEAAPRLLSRVTGALLSEFFAQAHRQAGVRLILDARVDAIVTEADVACAVRCNDEIIPADVVLIGIGMQANDALATESGLAVDAGILVDAFARTVDPQVFAIGDCARSMRPGWARALCIESVPNAVEQARQVAQLIMGQTPASPTPPWFWSDQYHLKLQMVGLSAGHDQAVLRGDMGQAAFMVFYLREGHLIAVDSVNCIAEFNVAKKLVAAEIPLSAENLGDANVDLKSLLVA